MNNLFNIKGKVVVITGGSGFLGAQYSQALEACGAVVENFDVSTGVNVVSEASLRDAVLKVIDKHGSIDGLITNAAINPSKVNEGVDADVWASYDNFSVDIFRKELDVNLVGSFLAAKLISAQMKKQKRGSIIFVSSDLGVIAPTNAIYPEGRFKDIAYGSSKAGTLGLMRFFAAYLGPYNVRVNALVPGGMDNNFDPTFVAKNAKLSMLGRMARKNEFNGAIQFLLSDASSYMTGSQLIIDGGRTAW